MNTRKKQLFLSLYWKATSGLAVVLLTLISFFTYFNAEQLTTVQTQYRHGDQQQYIIEFNGLLQKAALQLSNLIDSLPNLQANSDQLPAQIENHWLSLQITWGLESAVLFNAEGKELRRWGDSRVTPSQSSLSQARLGGAPSHEMVCHQYCKLAVTSPILDKRGDLYLIQLSVSLADTMLDFQSITGSDIGLLTSQRPNADPGNVLENTGLTISALTNRAVMQPLLVQLVKTQNWEGSIEASTSHEVYVIDTEFAQYEIMFHSTPELASSNAHVVFISDTTAARTQIEQARFTYSAAGLLAAAISLSLVVLALWQPLHSLQRQSRALPLLPEGKFEEAKTRLKRMTKNRFFADEITDLQETSIEVTEQLERYQKQLMKNSKKLYEMAHFDPLTGLTNRAHLTELIDEHLGNDDETEHRFALIYLDLDNFKHINDALGHDIGDRLLVVVAKRLKNCVGRNDYVARLGGDEFCLVLNHTHEQDKAGEVAQRVLKTLEEPIIIDDRNLAVSSSIGITMAPVDGDSAAALLQNADLAMYQAKAEGKNNFRIFSQDLYKDADTRIALESELRRAVQNEEFVLFYQPQIDLKSGELMGCEALIRWQHPERGTLSPFFFIDAIENNGLIIPVGKWIIREACRQCAEWSQLGLTHIKISINLSARQFSDPELLNDIKRAISDAGIQPSQLELEVTESLLATDIRRAIELLKELQSLGLTIAIDDFGTGYSSLSYLKQLPLDKLKIDRAFVKDIPDDNDDKQITSAIVAMAHSLNLRVVAEGVETREQQDYLRDLDCEYAQGFLIDKPLAPDSFIESELVQRMLTKADVQNNV